MEQNKRWPSEAYLIRNPYTSKKKPNKEFLRLLTEELTEYIERDDNILCLEQLFVKRGIRKRYWYKLRERYNIVKEAHEAIVETLVSRLRHLAITKKGSENYIKHYLTNLYDDDKKHAEYLESIKNIRFQSTDGKTEYKLIELPTWKRSSDDKEVH